MLCLEPIWSVFVREAVTPDALATVAAMGVAAMIYLICLFAFRAVDADDVAKVPVVGHRMYQWVKRLEK